jgi:autotransporter-associated beta strand protein
MSTNYEHNGEDETQAARRTAHALGQTDGAEWAEVEREMAASPQARQEVEAAAAMAQRLKEAAQLTPPAVHSPELRAAVEERLTALESAAQTAVSGAVRSWRRRLITWAVSAAALSLVAVTIMQSMKYSGRGESRQVAQSPASPRLDAPNKDLNEAAEIVARGAQPNSDRTQLESAEPVLTSPTKRSAITWQSLADSQRLPVTPPSSTPPQLYSDIVNPQGVGTTAGTGSTYSLQMTYDPNRLNTSSDGYIPAQGAQSSGNQAYNVGSSPVQVLAGANAYSGATTINGGAVQMANGARIGGEHVYSGAGMLNGNSPLILGYRDAKGLGNVHVAGGAINITNGAMIATTSGAGFMLSGASGVESYSGNIAGTLNVSGGLTYNSSNTYTGGTTVASGGVIAGNNASDFNSNDATNPLGQKPPSAGEPDKGVAAVGTHIVELKTSHEAMEQALKAFEREGVDKSGDGKSTTDAKPHDSNSSGQGVVKPVQIETLPGLDVMVIKANPGDVAKVEGLVKRAEEHEARPLQAEGKPAVASAAPAEPREAAHNLAIARTEQGFEEEKARIAAIERDYEARQADGRHEVLSESSGQITAEKERKARHEPNSGGSQGSVGSSRSPDQSIRAAGRDEARLKQLVESGDLEGARAVRERLRRELESIGAGDDRTASLRGQNAVNVVGEYRRELDKLQTEASQLRQQLQNQSLPGNERQRVSDQLVKANEVITEFGKEVARIEATTVKIDSKKPLETWKPARVVPNASRLMVGEKEELPLKGMQVDVRVDGFRARVLLDLYYLNDRGQQLEGNFQLRLPDEAAPYFFAFGRTVYQARQVTPSNSMFFKPQEVSLGDTTPEKILRLRENSWDPKVAKMVPKEKAAMAYREMERRRIDPALVEWSGAGVFQCRVFPLAPQSLHRVTIGYDVDLVRVGDDLELRLDLPEWQSATGAPATVVDLNVAATDARQVSLDAPATQSPDGRRLAYRLVDPKQRPLTVRLRKPGTLMLTGNDEATGNYFATRVTLPLPEGQGEVRSQKSEVRSQKAVFLVDTSLSAGPRFPLWTKMLRATLTNNRDQIKQFAVLFFNVETFWWQEKYVDNTPENVDAVLSYADNLALEGATDLGRALQEAAAPKWRKAEAKAAPDLFLLSDGAATWGEDRWGLLAAAITGKSKAAETALTPGPSPKGRGESSALFAYRTGLAGGDSRLLGYLAERTGGAVFSLVGEVEIATASVAHRNRPWRLTGLEMAGAHDVLVAGRPQYVYPGQQLTIVGRLESPIGGSSPGSTPPNITFTLQQGSATQTVKVAMEQVIPSDLAGRTFGQVATNQLEDVAGVEQSAEPVATAYARHFRITGRTCSLLMLESEQDYARFNIKPEEDNFVVRQRPADPIVSKTIADTVAAMSDPKTNFLAWYNRLAASEVRFDLPAALKVYIDGLPNEAFAVVPQALVCKLRLRRDLPEKLGRPWQTGMPDYDATDAEAQRRLAAVGADDALRCLSSLVEERPGDTSLARDLAFTAIDWQRPGEAYHLLRRASNARTFEPVTFHAMAHCLEQMGRADLAIIYYELACGGQWDPRFGDMHNIAMLDYARFLRRVVQENGGGKGDSPIFAKTKIGTVPYAQSRLAALDAMNLRDTADVAALVFWNTDGTDVDLHVIEPSGEECFYQHTQTASGGHISRDVTTGYGPELYLLPKAPSGRYEISAHYYATDMNRASTRTKVLAFIYENWGAKDEHVAIKSLALNGQKEKQELGVVKR